MEMCIYDRDPFCFDFSPEVVSALKILGIHDNGFFPIPGG
jgi:hypothetical protein